MKTNNRVFRLARWFVVDNLKQAWDSRNRGVHLKHASMLLKPKDGSKAYDERQIELCIMAMQEGVFPDWKGQPRFLLAVTYGTPPMIERMGRILDYLPPIPPVYMTSSRHQWFARFGKYIMEGANVT